MLCYRVIKIDPQGNRRATGTIIQVDGRRFSKTTDACAEAQLLPSFHDVNGVLQRYGAERIDAKAIRSLSRTLMEAGLLLREIAKTVETE